MEIHSQPSYGADLSALLAIFAGKLEPRVQIQGMGLLGIDPELAWVLGMVPVPGCAMVEIQVPAIPSLIGQTFYFQALMGYPEMRLTNVIAETVVPR